MNEDICYLFRSLRNIHPDLYQEYDSLFFINLEDKIKKSCSKPMSLLDFSLQLAKVQKFLDSHTGLCDISPVTFNNYCFPKVDFVSDSIIIVNTDTLILINNLRASILALEIDSMVSRMYLPEVINERKNIFLNVLLNSKSSNSSVYRCSLRNNKGVYDTIIPADTPSSLDVPFVQYDSLYFDDSIAVFQYNSSILATESDINRFQIFLDSFFCKLNRNGFNHLFIDLSNNGGGSGRANNLVFNYLNRDSCFTVTKLEGKPEGIKKIMDSKFYNKMYDIVFKPVLINGFILDTTYIPSKHNGFKGNVFVIMGNKTFSAAADFCYYAKISKTAALIGDISGQSFPFCGNCIYEELPNSKIKIQIPVTKSTYETFGDPFEGYLQPDIRYPIVNKLTIEDYRKILSITKE